MLLPARALPTDPAAAPLADASSAAVAVLEPPPPPPPGALDPLEHAVIPKVAMIRNKGVGWIVMVVLW